MKLSLCFLIAVFPFFIKAQYNDPDFPKPISGYGSDGPYSVGKVFFENPQFPGRNIEVYFPNEVQNKVPTIFYSHGFGGNFSSTISGLLEFVAKKGYAIVFVPYQTIGVTIDHRYHNLLNGL